jgi:hypothetical protein
MDTEGNKIKYLDGEELASLARRYYAARFPNPRRLGCPPSSEIIKVVGQRQAPDQALREHLFECSECFGEYRQALARRPAPEKVTWRNRLALVGAFKLSAAMLVLIFSLSLFFINKLIWRKPAPEAGNETASRSSLSEARAGEGGGAAPNQTVAGAIAAVPKSPADGLAMVGAWRSSSIPARGAETIDVDLDNYQVFRQSLRERLTDVSEDTPGRQAAKPPASATGSPAGEPAGEPDGEPSGEKVISLPAKRASLVLRLPETGVHGKYNVSLINAFGQSLYSTSAFSPDGSILRVALDLRRIFPKKCRLRLSRNGEAPAFYDVIIGGR